MKLVTCIVAAVAAIAAGEDATAQEAPVDSLALARQYTEWLYAGAGDSLAAHTAPGAREEFSSRAQWDRHTQQIATRAGREVLVLEETWKLRNGDCQYYRLSVFDGMEEHLVVRWVLTPEGLIAGIGLGPESQTPAFDRDHCGEPPAAGMRSTG